MRQRVMVAPLRHVNESRRWAARSRLTRRLWWAPTGACLRRGTRSSTVCVGLSHDHYASRKTEKLAAGPIVSIGGATANAYPVMAMTDYGVVTAWTHGTGAASVVHVSRLAIP